MDDELATLFRREHPRLVRSLALAFGSADQAADAVQDAFLQAHRHWRRISLYDDPAAWVRRVAVNKMLNGRRRLSRQAPPCESSVDDAVDGGRLDVVEALRRLPRQQRVATTLFYVGDLSVEEVADAMDVSAGTVKAHLHAARAKLATDLKEAFLD